jgi:RP/EB family microtubule-associated protein
MSNIGIMDGAFFVGRKEIVDWINSTLGLNILKIEQTANGCIACQLLDIMHPSSVSMSKVNWNAKQSFEFVNNYKVLQSAFSKLKIDKFVDVDKLIKGKYQDNLEFMQWFKRFFEMSIDSPQVLANYDAVGVRLKGKGGNNYNKVLGSGKAPVLVASSPSSAAPSTSGENAKENRNNAKPTHSVSNKEGAANTNTKTKKIPPRLLQQEQQRQQVLVEQEMLIIVHSKVNSKTPIDRLWSSNRRWMDLRRNEIFILIN